MAATSKILAQLGIDSSKVPEELAEADKFFKKFAQEAEKTAGTKAGSDSGSKFMKAFQGRFSGAGLFGMLSAALGLNIDKISDKLAEAFQKAFGGGTQKAFEEADKAADEVAKKQEELFYERLTTAQKVVKLEAEIGKAIDKQVEMTKTGKDLTAEQLTELAKAQAAQLDAEKKLAEIRKSDEESSKDYLKKRAEYDREQLSKKEQVTALEKEIYALAMEASKAGQTDGEKDKKRLEMLEKQKQIDQLSKEITDDKQKAEEKITKEKEKQLDLDEKIAATNRKLRDAKSDLSEKKTALGDRSKLTVAELASLPAQQRQIDVEAARDEKRRREAFTFGADAGLSEEQRNAKAQAQKVLDLEAEAEQARIGGNQSKAEEIFGQVGQLRESLVGSGTVKSTEGDTQKALLKEVQKQTEGVQELVKQVEGFKTAKLKNQ